MNDFPTCHYCSRPAWYQDRKSGEMLCQRHTRLEPRGPASEADGSVIQVRMGKPADKEIVLAFWRHFWDDDGMDCFGREYEAVRLDHLLACEGEQIVGTLSFAIERDWDAANVIALNVKPAYQGKGVGSRLMEALEDHARQEGLGRLILATSNDNLLALYFYQQLGFHISGVEINSIQADGTGDNLIGTGGIPVRDEIRLEKRLLYSK